MKRQTNDNTTTTTLLSNACNMAGGSKSINTESITLIMKMHVQVLILPTEPQGSLVAARPPTHVTRNPGPSKTTATI